VNKAKMNSLMEQFFDLQEKLMRLQLETLADEVNAVRMQASMILSLRMTGKKGKEGERK